MSVETWVGRLSVAIAVTCATAVTATAVALTMPSVRASLGLRATEPKPSYAPGEVLDLPPQVFRQAAHTVVILFRPDCGACVRLKPYLTRLAARQQAQLRVVAVTGVGNPTDAVQFVRQIGLDPSLLVTTNLEKTRAKTVPTVVLVDGGGRIQSVFEGIPTTEIQEDLLRQVTALSHRR